MMQWDNKILKKKKHGKTSTLSKSKKTKQKNVKNSIFSLFYNFCLQNCSVNFIDCVKIKRI